MTSDWAASERVGFVSDGEGAPLPGVRTSEDAGGGGKARADGDVLAAGTEVAAAGDLGRDRADGDAADTQVVPGGWKRAAIGLVVGLVAGAITALALPRVTQTGPGAADVDHDTSLAKKRSRPGDAGQKRSRADDAGHKRSRPEDARQTRSQPDGAGQTRSRPDNAGQGASPEIL